MSQSRIWDRFAKGYAKSPVKDEAAYQRKLELTAARLTPQTRMLEVGCGTGTTALIHAPRVAEVVATDFSPEMIRIARAKAAEQGIENVSFQVAAIEDLPVPDHGYDVVSAQSVLHLMADPAATLAHLARMVRPGGYVVTSTTCIGEMGALVRLLPVLSFTRLIPRVSVLKRSDLIAAHGAAGLEILEEFRPRPDAAVFIVAQRPE